jgi:phage repressor protein C with HTH and peptisase S24 domain
VAQHVVDLGRPHGTTTPDFFFPTDDPNAPGTCIYLDGLSGGLHGNPETQRRDVEITNLLESRGYFVLRLAASELDDRAGMARFFYNLGKELLGRDRARAVRDETGWFEGGDSATTIPFERVRPRDEDKYTTCVPLVTLRAAAGKFGEVAAVEEAEWVRPSTRQRLHKGMFVAQVVGKSMEPRIPDGAYCLFTAPLLGHPNAKVALVQLRSIDVDTGGGYTVKKLEEAGDRIRLVPLNPAFEAMEFAASDEDVRPVAELIQVLPEL